MGISIFSLLIFVFSVCSVAARNGSHDNQHLLKRLENLEDYQKLGETRLSKLEDDYHAQTSVIEKQKKTIDHLEETVQKLSTNIAHAHRISRSNRRQISLIRGLLLKKDLKDGPVVPFKNNDITKTGFQHKHNQDNKSNQDEHFHMQNHNKNTHQHSHQQNNNKNPRQHSHQHNLNKKTQHSHQQNNKTSAHPHSRPQNLNKNTHHHSHQQNNNKNTHQQSHQQNRKINTHQHSHQQNHKTNTHKHSNQQNLKTNTPQHSHKQNRKANTHQHSHQQNHKTNTHQHSHKQNHETNAHKQNHKTNTTKSSERSHPRNHNHHNNQHNADNNQVHVHVKQHSTKAPPNTHGNQGHAGHANGQMQFGSKENKHAHSQNQSQSKFSNSGYKGHKGHDNAHTTESQKLEPTTDSKQQHKQDGNSSDDVINAKHYHTHSNELNGKDTSGSNNHHNHQSENQETRHMSSDESQTRHRSLKTPRQAFGGIAFSVYLDHDATVAQHETVKFNKIITNDGGGYNAQTGIFTCSEGGVYMLTFSIGQRDQDHYMWAELMVNNKNMIDAVVDTYHPAQDLQGGNTVIVRLNPGDRVWIDATHNGSHVEGSGTLRLTTFSGLYLYS